MSYSCFKTIKIGRSEIENRMIQFLYILTNLINNGGGTHTRVKSWSSEMVEISVRLIMVHILAAREI
jgi:hypothetical protein